MRRLYIDCTNGISSDMVLYALIDAGAYEHAIKEARIKSKHLC